MFKNLLASFTGKSLSEALIFASTNPQYDDRLFIVHENCKLRIPAEHVVYTNCCFCFDIQNNFGTQHVLQMLRASKKDFTVNIAISENLKDFLVTLLLTYGKIFFPELDADCYEFCPALRPCGWRRHLSSGRFLFALSDNGYSAGKVL